MDENSGEFSDELDEFEESVEEHKNQLAKKANNQTTYNNKPYDEAYEVSQDLSMAESFDGRKDVSTFILFIIYPVLYLIQF